MNLLVDAPGNPQSLHVSRPLGKVSLFTALLNPEQLTLAFAGHQFLGASAQLFEAGSHQLQ